MKKLGPGASWLLGLTATGTRGQRPLSQGFGEVQRWGGGSQHTASQQCLGQHESRGWRHERPSGVGDPSKKLCRCQASPR